MHSLGSFNGDLCTAGPQPPNSFFFFFSLPVFFVSVFFSADAFGTKKASHCLFCLAPSSGSLNAASLAVKNLITALKFAKPAALSVQFPVELH